MLATCKKNYVKIEMHKILGTDSSPPLGGEMLAGQHLSYRLI